MARIGVIGLGSMGFGMAKCALQAGHSVSGYDVSASVCDQLGKIGGTSANSPADAANGVDILLIMVVNGAQCEQALFGENGAAGTLREGAVVVVSTTMAPAEIRTISQNLASRNIELLDAPVSGGQVAANAGTLSIMASGSAEAFAKAAPLLDAVAGKVYSLGDEPGMGATYKVVHQLAAGAHIAIAAEAMALGAAAGCDTRTLFDIITNSAGASWMFANRVPHMLDDDFSPKSAVDIFVKDLGLVTATAEANGMELPVAQSALEQFRAASHAGFGKLDDAAVVKLYEAQTGAPVCQDKK